jgi:hypothetical protein
MKELNLVFIVGLEKKHTKNNKAFNSLLELMP